MCYVLNVKIGWVFIDRRGTLYGVSQFHLWTRCILGNVNLVLQERSLKKVMCLILISSTWL